MLKTWANFELTIAKKRDIMIKLSDERSGTEKKSEMFLDFGKLSLQKFLIFLKKVLDKTADK